MPLGHKPHKRITSVWYLAICNSTTDWPYKWNVYKCVPSSKTIFGSTNNDTKQQRRQKQILFPSANANHNKEYKFPAAASPVKKALFTAPIAFLGVLVNTRRMWLVKLARPCPPILCFSFLSICIALLQMPKANGYLHKTLHAGCERASQLSEHGKEQCYVLQCYQAKVKWKRRLALLGVNDAFNIIAKLTSKMWAINAAAACSCFPERNLLACGFRRPSCNFSLTTCPFKSLRHDWSSSSPTYMARACWPQGRLGAWAPPRQRALKATEHQNHIKRKQNT